MPDKKKKEKVVGFKEFDPSKFIETEPTLEEAAKGTAVIAWGRMNPMTAGHEKLVKKVMAVAKSERGQPEIYLTHSFDKKKNPLAYDTKIKYAQKAFGPIVKKSTAKTIFQLMKQLETRFNRVVLVAGSDRVKEFNNTLNKYNGKEYNFDEIKVVSAGQRDADSDDVSGISGTKMRDYAATDMKKFTANLPKRLQGDAEEIASLVRSGMGLSEELDEALSRAARRKMAITMRRNKAKIKIGREKAKRRRKDSGKMQSIARRKAIKLLQAKFAKHKRYADMDPSEKERIEKKISKVPKERIERIARKMLIQVKKDERERFSKMATDNPSTPQREDINLKVEQYLEERENMDEKIGKIFKGAKDAAKIARGLNKARKFIGSPMGKAAAIGGAAVGAASAARTVHNVSKGVGKAGGYVAGKVANAFDKKDKKKVESFSTFVESKTIKVGESAIGAEGVTYALVKDREIQAIGDKADMLAVAESDGGRVWMVSSENQVGDLLENKAKAQDPDIKDLPGTQPKEYFKGVEKDKKDDRDRHFKRNSKKSDNDPSAYKPAPGDKEAKTKTSKHTKKFKQMYGEMQEMWGQRVSNRPHMLMDKNNKVKFDKRFKMYKLQQKELEESLDVDEVLDLMESMDYVESYMEMLDESAKAGLKKKAEKSGMPYGILKKVYDRGMAAWKGGHRPGTTPQQWGMARVNSFTTKSSGTWGGADKDLAAKVRKEEVEQIDEVAPLLLVKPAAKIATKIAAKAADAVEKERTKNKKEQVDNSDDYEKERRKAIKKAVNTKPALDEKLDRDFFHTSVERGVFGKHSSDGNKEDYLLDLDNKAGGKKDGPPMLVTFAKEADAKKAQKKFGGKIVKTKFGTYRIKK